MELIGSIINHSIQGVICENQMQPKMIEGESEAHG